MTYLGYELCFPERPTNFDSRFVEPLLNGPLDDRLHAELRRKVSTSAKF